MSSDDDDDADDNDNECDNQTDGYGLHIGSRIRRMNAVKIKRSQTEGHQHHDGGATVASPFDHAQLPAGGPGTFRCRRHSIQCVSEPPFVHGASDHPVGQTIASAVRRLSVIGPDCILTRFDVATAEMTRKSRKTSTAAGGGRHHLLHHGLAARASMFLSGGHESRKKSLPDRSSFDIVRPLSSGGLQRKLSLASCEVFTLKFESLADVTSTHSQTVPALKDFNLGQVLVGPLEQRGLSVEHVDVFLESSNTPLPLSSDCFRLAGSVLHVRARDDSKRPLHLKSSSFSGSGVTGSQKSQNGNLRPKRNGCPDECGAISVCSGDVSPYGTLSRGLDVQKFKSTKGTSRLQSLFNPFTKATDKQELLTEILNGYSLNGLPNPPAVTGDATTTTTSLPVYDDRLFEIEPSWTVVVRHHETLDKRQRDHQEAVWELLTTEVEYIRKLRVIIDLFMCCLTNLQSTEQLLTEVESEKLFSNIVDVYSATCQFWISHMSRVVGRSRETGDTLNSTLFKDGFLLFNKIFEPYTRYCLEQEMCREYIKTKTAENELFRTFIVWCESQKQCGRLKLVDLIVKPWQRLTKYKLLLYAMKSPLEKMDGGEPTVEEQINAIDSAIEQVDKFTLTVNLALRQRQDHHQLSLATDRLESYEAVEAPNDECVKLVSEFCKLDLTCPVPGCSPQEMRILLLEGALRLKDNYAKTDVYCFLFTDMLLVTKCVTRRSDKVRVIKPPMRLDKIVVHGLRDQASFMLLYLNEYHMAQAVYIFYGDTRTWLEAIAKAQAEYRQKRAQFLVRFESVPLDVFNNIDIDDDANTSPLLGGRPSSAIGVPYASTRPVFRQDSGSGEEVSSLGGDVQRTTIICGRPSSSSVANGRLTVSVVDGRLSGSAETFQESGEDEYVDDEDDIVDAAPLSAGGSARRTTRRIRSTEQTTTGSVGPDLRRSCNSEPVIAVSSWNGGIDRSSSVSSATTFDGPCGGGGGSDTASLPGAPGSVCRFDSVSSGAGSSSSLFGGGGGGGTSGSADVEAPSIALALSADDEDDEDDPERSTSAVDATLTTELLSRSSAAERASTPASSSSLSAPLTTSQRPRLSLIDQRRMTKEILLNSIALEASDV